MCGNQRSSGKKTHMSYHIGMYSTQVFQSPTVLEHRCPQSHHYLGRCYTQCISVDTCVGPEVLGRFCIGIGPDLVQDYLVYKSQGPGCSDSVPLILKLVPLQSDDQIWYCLRILFSSKQISTETKIQNCSLVCQYDSISLIIIKSYCTQNISI